MINIVEVKTQKQKKQFVDFPTKLYNGNDYYVHPLRGDELDLFNPKKNVSYDDCEIVFYLAYKDGEVAGRICGIVQRVYNEKTNTKKVRFSRFDCIEDFEVASALLSKVEEWAKMQGMDTVHGPLGFNDLDREGLLIEGFDRLATFEENYNYPYYKDYLEQCGYKKDTDYLAFRIKLPEETGDRMKRLSDAVMKRYKLHIATEKSKKSFMNRYKDQIFDVLDEAYGDLYGVIPFNEKMRKQIVDQFNLVIRKEFIVAVVDENDRVVAFGFALPSLANAVKKSKGRLNPIGIARLLYAANHGELVDFGLIGVRKEYQGKGLTAIILDYVIRVAKQYGIKEVETNQSLEYNLKILQTWKNFEDVDNHKRYRLFTKSLVEPKKKETSKKKSTTKKKTSSSKTTKKTTKEKTPSKTTNSKTTSQKSTEPKATTRKSTTKKSEVK